MKWAYIDLNIRAFSATWATPSSLRCSGSAIRRIPHWQEPFLGSFMGLYGCGGAPRSGARGRCRAGRGRLCGRIEGGKRVLAAAFELGELRIDGDPSAETSLSLLTSNRPRSWPRRVGLPLRAASRRNPAGSATAWRGGVSGYGGYPGGISGSASGSCGRRSCCSPRTPRRLSARRAPCLGSNLNASNFPRSGSEGARGLGILATDFVTTFEMSIFDASERSGRRQAPPQVHLRAQDAHITPCSDWHDPWACWAEFERLVTLRGCRPPGRIARTLHRLS